MANSISLSERIRNHRPLLIIAVVQIVVLTLVAMWVMDIVIVEDPREVVDGVETITFRRELIGDPLLFVLAAIGMSLPLLSSRLRREPVMMLAVQLAIVALLIFVLWPVAQVFVEGFESTEVEGAYSLEHFQRLLTKPMVARATPQHALARGDLGHALDNDRSGRGIHADADGYTLESMAEDSGGHNPHIATICSELRFHPAFGRRGLIT